MSNANATRTLAGSPGATEAAGPGRRGRLIALEGGEASGKSTQAVLLARALGALLTREPGGTPLGVTIRATFLGPPAESRSPSPGTGSRPASPGAGPVSSPGPPPAPRAEALLLAADRAHHVATVVGPALAEGRWVVTDRFSGSFLAYQGYGRGLDLDELSRLSSWATDGLRPDLTILLDVPEEEAGRRSAGRPRPLDRLEAEGGPFHQRVRSGYLALARAHPRCWVLVDGVGATTEVAARVWAAVIAGLGRPGPVGGLSGRPGPVGGLSGRPGPDG